MMSDHEQQRYGTVHVVDPIPVDTSSPFIASTPNAIAPPEQALQAYNAVIRRDLEQRQQHR
jgi:hypothetical protein